MWRIQPPSGSWEENNFSNLDQYEVVFPERHDEDLDISDAVLPRVFGILEEQLIIASGLLEDIETSYFRTPSCYLGREIIGDEYCTKSAEILTWFVPLVDRMAEKWPELTNAHVMLWPVTERFFFRKLKLYAFSKMKVFNADRVAEEILSLDYDGFWDTNVTRELLFLLTDRWQEFSLDNRNKIIERILEGPRQLSHCSDEEFPMLRDELAAKYARYLELKECELTEVHCERLTSIIKSIPDWDDGWATSVVISWGSQTDWVRTDEKPDVVISLPVNEIIPKIKEELRPEYGNFIRKRPFTGLVKENPRKALSALTIAGKVGDYPNEFWSSMIKDFPRDVTHRLKRLFLNRIARLPNAVIIDLGYTLGCWLEQNMVAILKFDADLGWAVYDHVVEGIMSGQPNTIRNGLDEVYRSGKVITQSRRTYSNAISSHVGMCAQALFHCMFVEKLEAGSLIPDYIKLRIERLFTAPGEGADHAVSIATHNMNRLMFIDPDWTKEYLIPMLSFEHPASEAAWNGYLRDVNVPSVPVAKLVKPLMLKLIPWIGNLSWEREDLVRVAEWLGFMRVFRPDDPSGLSRSEMRSVLRTMSDETRNRFINWLGLVGQKNESGWDKYVIPLINKDWPRERRYRTSASMRAWIGLLDDTGNSFPAVYSVVKIFLVPVETHEYPFYRFIRKVGNKEPITIIFPETTLDLMNRTTPLNLTRPPDELQNVLTLIAETKPELTSDPRYLRLIDLIDRS